MVRALLLISTFNYEIWNLWEGINRVVNFFFGISDNITSRELHDLWIKEGITITDDWRMKQSLTNSF